MNDEAPKSKQMIMRVTLFDGDGNPLPPTTTVITVPADATPSAAWTMELWEVAGDSCDG